MAKKKQFEDPLEGIDPIMEQAFSETKVLEEDSSDWEKVDYVGLGDSEADASHEEVVKSEPRQKTKKATEKAQSLPLVEEDSDYDEVASVQFPNLAYDAPGKKVELDVFSNIPVNLSVELGRSQISLKEVFELSEGSIIELERLVGEPLDLVVNGQVIAQGEVVAIDNNYGLRITHIVSGLH